MADPGRPIPAIGSLSGAAVELIKALRRGGLAGPILGPDAISDDAFADRFKNEPEEKARVLPRPDITSPRISTCGCAMRQRIGSTRSPIRRT